MLTSLLENLLQRMKDIELLKDDDKISVEIYSISKDLTKIVASDYETGFVKGPEFRSALGNLYHNIGNLSSYYRATVLRKLVNVTIMLISKFVFMSEDLDDCLLPLVSAMYHNCIYYNIKEPGIVIPCIPDRVPLSPKIIKPLIDHHNSCNELNKSLFLLYKIVDAHSLFFEEWHDLYLQRLMAINSFFEDHTINEEMLEIVKSKRTAQPFRHPSSDWTSMNLINEMDNSRAVRKAINYMITTIGYSNARSFGSIYQIKLPVEYYWYPSEGLEIDFLGDEYGLMEMYPFMRQLMDEKYIRVETKDQYLMSLVFIGEPMGFYNYVHRLHRIHARFEGENRDANKMVENIPWIYMFGANNSGISIQDMSKILLPALCAYGSEELIDDL